MTGAPPPSGRPTPRFGVLGGLSAVRAGAALDLGGPKQRAVLAALLVDLGRPVPADRVVDRVWGGSPPPRAGASLQAYVANLRRVLEPDRRPRESPRLLVTGPVGYSLLVDRADVDAYAFEDAVRAGHEQLRAGDATTAVATLDAALSWWSGAPLPELDDDWVREWAAGLEALHAQAEEDRIDAGLALGDHELLVARIEAAVAAEPFRERRRAQLARALYRCGRQRDALASLADARRVLAEEVGVDPGEELRRLEVQILDHAPELDVAAPVPAVAAGAPAPSAPSVASATPDGAARPFVGRSRELDAARTALTRLRAGQGGAVVVSGDAGIGKTRLVEELTADAGDVAVAWGRCPESAAQSAYWPCVQLGRQLDGAGALEGDLLGELLPDGDAPLPPEDGSADRLGLHQSVVRMLGALDRPAVLVLDDLQWADPATLRLVEFVAGALARLRVLLVATLRPVGADAPGALTDCLAELARVPDTVRLDLDGLTAAAVTDWLTVRTGRVPDPETVALVRDRTAGNAFFVGELVELYAAGELDHGSDRRVPAAVHDVIRRRIGGLPAATQQLLAAASVVGRTFDVDVLAAVVDRGALEVLDALDPALASGLVESTDLPGRLQFAHALVADALVAELTEARRARLHAATVDALARLRAADLDAHLADLSFHAYEGLAAGTAPVALDWATRSARAAAARLGFEDAAVEWRRALRAHELARPDDGRGTVQLLLELADVELAIDDVAAAYATLVRAVDVGIGIGATDLVARAASRCSIDGLWFAGEIGLVEVDVVGALERALDVMGDDPTPERALALGALAENSYWSRTVAELDELTGAAVTMAERLDDPAVLGRVLHKRAQVLWHASSFEPRRDAAARLADLAGAHTLPPEIEAIAYFGRAGVSWETGDLPATVRDIATARAIADRLGSPALITQLGYFAAVTETHLGRLDAAEAVLWPTAELYRRTRRWQAEVFTAGFAGMIAVERGDAAAVREYAATITDSPYRPFFKEAAGFWFAELGDLERVATLAADGPPPFVDSWMDVGATAAALHARVAIGDLDTAAELLARLVPFRERLATVGTGPCFGSVSLALAAGARALGDLDTARREVDHAVALIGRAGRVPWLARALVQRAAITGDDADRAEAAAIADALGVRRPRGC